MEAYKSFEAYKCHYHDITKVNFRQFSAKHKYITYTYSYNTKYIHMHSVYIRLSKILQKIELAVAIFKENVSTLSGNFLGF